MKKLLFWLKASIIVLITIPMAIITALLLPFNYKGKIYHFMAKIWSRIILAIFNIKVKTSGLENIAEKRNYIYISNHASAMDIPALICAIPDQIRFLAKQELGKIPLWGWLLKHGGYILIDRKNPKRAIKSIQKAIEKIKNGVSVLVFAEGTRSIDGKLLPFKRGGFMLAIKSNTPIVPVTILGSHKIMQKHKLEINPGMIEILIDKPIQTENFSGKEGEIKLMEAVRKIISTNLENKIRDKTMPVTIKDVEYIANLARLEFKEAEKEKFTEQFNRILEYMSKLNELDTTDVEPLYHVIDIKNVFRDDVVKPSYPREEILKNAPSRTEYFFKVPKVIPIEEKIREDEDKEQD